MAGYGHGSGDGVGRGLEPVKPFLAAIDSVQDVRGLMHVVAAQARMGMGSFMGFFVGADDKNSQVNAAQSFQAGIGLPDRDYYFRTDSAGLAAIAAYKKYLATLLDLALGANGGGSGGGVGNGAAQAEKIFALEKQLAASHKTQAAHTDSIINRQPKYYEALNRLLTALPLADWKLYVRAHTLDNAANYLGHDFGDKAFQYDDKALSGQQKIKPRWERMYEVIDGNLGEALGQLYVQQYFPPEAKRRITELVDNLQKAFAQRIDKLDWMGDTTKQRAKAKLMAILKKVGYPDKWRSGV